MKQLLGLILLIFQRFEDLKQNEQNIFTNFYFQNLVKFTKEKTLFHSYIKGKPPKFFKF